MGFPPTPAVITDCVLFDGKGRILLVRRGSEPFKGLYALPGGFVDVGETVEDACRREVHEEAGVQINEPLQLVGVYSDPRRDPRGHSVSIAYTTVLAEAQQPHAGSDAQGVEWVQDWKNEDLAFNHKAIIADTIAKIHKVPDRIAS